MRKIFLFVAAVVCAASTNAQEPLPSEVLQYGKFSVSSTKKVMFSKGNLQYQADPGSWHMPTGGIRMSSASTISNKMSARPRG